MASRRAADEDEEDPVLAFFDFSKPRKEIRLLEGYRSCPVASSAGPTEELTVEDNVVEDEEYWVESRKKAERAMANSSLRSDKISGEKDKEGVVTSRMSEIEANTLAGSSRMGDKNRIGGEDVDAALYKKYSSEQSRSTAAEAHRSTLTIAKSAGEIMDLLADHQVVIITGHTGCGKSTQVPQYIMDHLGQKNKPFNIVVTQPRRIAAQSLAKRVCQERGLELGTLVGYKVGLDKAQVSKDTRLLYCTTGVLKKMIIAKKAVHDFTHIILDEVHEREEDMDFLLLLIKHFINTNSRGVKLILMSATIETHRFMEYFATTITTASQAIRNWPGQVSVDAKGRQFNVEELHLDDLMEHVPRGAQLPTFDSPALHPACVEICTLIVNKLDEMESNDQRKTGPGTALIFLPGEAEIQTVRTSLTKSFGPKWSILVLHSRIPVDDINKVFQPDPSGRRKVILSTNIAESSLTIPDVEYVIDFCLTKILEADPDTNYVALKLHWADQNSCVQRSGRAGRVKNGRVYRLVPKKFFALLEPQHRPEITRAPLDKLILDAKMLDVDDVEGLGSPKDILGLAMDPPELRNIHKTILHLKEIGALLTTVNGVPCREDGDLTLLGEILASLPVDVRLGKLIVLGHVLGVLNESIIIAAGLSNKSIFSTPMDKKLEAYSHKLVWANKTFSDCFAVLIAYTTWFENKAKGHLDRRTAGASFEARWCWSRFLQLKCLNEMSNSIEDIKVSLRHQHIEDFPTPNRAPLTENEKYSLLQYAIFGAFYPNYFVSKTAETDLREAYKTINGLHLANTVYLQGFPIDQAQMGELYAADIKKIFEICALPERMNVTFSNSKVFVEFAPIDDDEEIDPRQDIDLNDLRQRRNITGEIMQQVYVALKLRDARQRSTNMFLRVFSFQEACLALEQKQQQRDLMSKKAQPRRKNDFRNIGRISPPGLKVKFCRVDVVHVNHPGSFWVQFHDAESQRCLGQLDEAIGGVLSRAPATCASVHDVLKNHVYLTPHTDNAYYRARVESIIDDLYVEMFFIDFGNRSAVRWQNLIDLDDELCLRFPDLVRIPAMAMECSLARIRPNPIRTARGVWDQEAIRVFSEVSHVDDYSDHQVDAEIYSVVAQADSPLVAVVLHADGRVINEYMKEIVYPRNQSDNEEGLSKPPYAISSAESYPSEQSHLQRENSTHLDEKFTKSIEEDLVRTFSHNRWAESTENTPPACPEGSEAKARVNEIKLRGPFSPLEFKLACVHQMGAIKDIKIEPESVNSVLLNRYPDDHVSQWLVAAHVGMNPSSSALQLRSTTFMPARPGLGAILAMIFAPVVEMRADQQKTRYTGCLLGLGHRPFDWGRGERTGDGPSIKKVAFHPDHDMEVQLDINFDHEDLHVINKIRYYLNEALTRDRVTRPDGTTMNLAQRRVEGLTKFSNVNDLLRVRTEIHKNLNLLFEKHREVMPLVYFPKRCAWDQLSKEDKLEAMKFDKEESKKFIWKLIDGIELEDQ